MKKEYSAAVKHLMGCIFAELTLDEKYGKSSLIIDPYEEILAKVHATNDSAELGKILYGWLDYISQYYYLHGSFLQDCLIVLRADLHEEHKDIDFYCLEEPVQSISEGYANTIIRITNDLSKYEDARDYALSVFAKTA